MGTPITKAAIVICDSQGSVDLSKVTSKLQIGGNDVVDAADVGIMKVKITGCQGHPKGNGPVCNYITKWTILLTALQDDGQPVAGLATPTTPPTPVATSDVLAAMITCTDPGNKALTSD